MNRSGRSVPGSLSPSVETPSRPAGRNERPSWQRRALRAVLLLLGIWFILVVLRLSLVLYLGTPANMACLFQGRHVPIDQAQLHGAGSLYLLPLDGFPVDALERLAEHYGEKYGLPIHVAQSLIPPPSAFDEGRNQFVCERLVDFVRQEFHPEDKHPVVLAFSRADMYLAGVNWGYAFGCRNADAGVGMISSSRMAYPFMGFWPVDAAWQESRLRKMTTRYIGLLYYKLPFTNVCRSVMFASVGGPQELDFMGEDF